MSKNETVVSTEVTPSTSHTDSAQELLQEVRQMRGRIPHFVIPTSAKERARMNSTASLPPEFMELTAVAVANENSLVRGDGLTPSEMRDLTGYAESYLPFADELEALAQFIRHSATVARHTAATEALTIYALAQRLAKRPKTAHLAPYVADMRRALGRVPKLTAEERQKRAAAKAAKEAAAKDTVQPS
jgi:hypothetical protein